MPAHFLHVWLYPLGRAELEGAGPCALDYRRVTCFHQAVAVEVDAPALRRLNPEPTFLPHLTIAITTRPAPPDELREVIRGLRDEHLGSQRAEEAIRVTFPFSRERLFEPWTMHERVSL